MYRRLLPLLTFLSQSAASGAQSILVAATDPRLRGGELIGPGGVLGIKGTPGPQAIKAQAVDLDAARRLWEISERLTRVTFP